MPDDPLLKLHCENFFVRGIRVHAERETAALGSYMDSGVAISEANEVKLPTWWATMLTPEGQRDFCILNDLRSSLKEVEAATGRMEQRKAANSQEIENG